MYWDLKPGMELETFAAKRDKSHPTISRLWRRNWDKSYSFFTLWQARRRRWQARRRRWQARKRRWQARRRGWQARRKR
ncbi:MAG TPA: hypothetical protein DDY22_02710, partial [Geobacter sp.]|nr:hypothetical protein [Geobacter sp.]